MALLNNYTIKKGTTVQLEEDYLPSFAQSGEVVLSQDIVKSNKYFKVINITTSLVDGKMRGEALVNVLYSSNSTKSIGNEWYCFDIDKSGDNFIKQAYEYLKTLDEYSDSVDC